MIEPASAFHGCGKGLRRFLSGYSRERNGGGLGTGQAVAMRFVDDEDPLHRMALMEGF